MTSQLSDEEFRRLQTQLIELRTANYGLEEQCTKYRSDNQALSTKLGALEREYQKVQKSVDRSKKAKDIDLLLNENENLQVKLQAQEDDFRLQNQTLLWELSALTATNEKLEHELAVLRALNDAANATGNSAELEREGHHLQVEKTVLTSILVKEHRKAEQKLEELREIIQSFSSTDCQQKEAEAEQGNSVPSSEGDFVQVDETDVAYQKQGTLQTDLLREAEQKLQYLEAYQKNIGGLLVHFEAEKEEKKQVQSEVKQLQDKLHRKQESLLKLQEEKEKLYTESREAYEQLQGEKEQEVVMLKEQNQRLQVQLNNTQVSLHDLKEKSSQHIRELESHVSLLERKNESTSKEHLMEMQAKVMELEYVLKETKEKLIFVEHQKSQLESHLTDTREKLNQKQNLVSALEEQKNQLSSALDEVSLVAQKRKNLVDEMSIRIQQKSDDYKHQLSDLTNEFSNREEELKKQIEAFQEEVHKLAPLQSQLDDALVQVKSLEAMKQWLECQQKEAEDSIKSTQTYCKNVMEHLKTEHDRELSQLKLFYENCEKALQEELESLQSEGRKKDENLNRLGQQLHDAGEEKQLAEKKGIAVMKDLRRQLAAERKRSEKLQERMRDLLNEGTHTKTDVNKSVDPETSSVSSWSLMSGNCEPRESVTCENSTVGGSVSNFNGNISPPPKDQDLEQENYRLLSRITALQQEKWVLEEKINHLEQGSAAMAEDLMHKTALIQYYCIEGKSGPVATSSPPPSNERLSMKKFVEKLKGDEHIHESNRRMQRMLEEMLTKNMHLQTNLEQLSLEVVRLSKEADHNMCT